MKEYQIKVTSVDYCVEVEDVDPLGELTEEQEDEEIELIKNRLPQDLMLEITCDPDDLEDEIADAISEETGWLNNSFTYDVVSEKEVDDADYPDAIGS